MVFDDTADTYVAGVFDEATGIGSGDSIRLYDEEGNLLDSHSWTEHANYEGDESTASLGRYPDGTGEFVDFSTPTKGKPNVVVNPVVINEIQSSDPNGGPDWIELANPTDADLDISGIVVKDDDDTHEYVIPEVHILFDRHFVCLWRGFRKLVHCRRGLFHAVGRNDSSFVSVTYGKF